jgi:hypothetical protein
MIPISQRLRARLEPIGDGSGKWRPDGLCQEAADITDVLVAAVPDLSSVITWLENGCEPKAAVTELRIYQSRIDAALAKAKGKQG